MSEKVRHDYSQKMEEYVKEMARHVPDEAVDSFHRIESWVRELGHLERELRKILKADYGDIVDAVGNLIIKARERDASIADKSLRLAEIEVLKKHADDDYRRIESLEDSLDKVGEEARRLKGEHFSYITRLTELRTSLDRALDDIKSKDAIIQSYREDIACREAEADREAERSADWQKIAQDNRTEMERLKKQSSQLLKEVEKWFGTEAANHIKWTVHLHPHFEKISGLAEGFPDYWKRVGDLESSERKEDGVNIEYGVRQDDGGLLNLNDPVLTSDELFWTRHRHLAESNAKEYGGTLVRRIVGPVEVIDG